MAIVLQEDMTFTSSQEAFEKVGMLFYRIEKMANVALEINSYKQGDFKDPLYREECVYYQLEIIRDLAKQFDGVFVNIAGTFGHECDSRLKELERLESGVAELLPENSDKGVLSAGPASES